ncbi:Gfo/Idh/MocA family protein [Halopiger xanaduensis]|uniref:Oxidoreductase domain protein n=1 Tax=Halopiger xanaduensis (strain DSM 18323 / JCM 14033 / SH-6) TaxID=797210 RepID=F8D3G4_HALXS|nr:Gfo/Idh/MocA family oxidoreductase [Halopiger xanaduensis]AEH36190.1 oxidoreductase domain protein [Halopiger xanaduensis SH-6]
MDFGVLSTAGIARKAFLPGIEPTEHEVTAVASRDLERAEAFADEFGIDDCYEGYEALIEESDVDAVYIPLPNEFHAEWTKKTADAGIDVLCEKPLTVDAAEAREVVAHCEERGVTLMEGFMYLYHPRTERALELASEELEDVRSVTASFKFPLFGSPDDIRLSPDLHGGSLMDVGCYPVSLVRQVLGEPDSVYTYTNDSRGSGVDTELAGILEYHDASARIASGFDTQDVQRYRIEAANGWIEVEGAFNPSSDTYELEYEIDGRHAVETFDPVDQYRLEIEHFADCAENDRQPRTDGNEAIANMAVIDALYESAETDRAVDVDDV